MKNETPQLIDFQKEQDIQQIAHEPKYIDFPKKLNIHKISQLLETFDPAFVAALCECLEKRACQAEVALQLGELQTQDD